MFHNEVEVVDSVYAVVLIDIAMDVSSILNVNISARSTFPDSPVDDYCGLLENVLDKLNLHDIFQKEIASVRRNKTKVSGNHMSRFFKRSEQNENRTPSAEEVTKRYVLPTQTINEIENNNHERKRKTIVDGASQSNEKNKKNRLSTSEELDVNVNENCNIIGSKSTVQEENKECRLEPLENDYTIASTKYSKLTKPSFEDFEGRKDLLPACSSQGLTMNDEIRDDNKNKNCDKEKMNEEINKDDTSTKNNGRMKSQENLYKDSFISDDLAMLMLMPDVNDKFDIDLDIDLSDTINI